MGWTVLSFVFRFVSPCFCCFALFFFSWFGLHEPGLSPQKAGRHQSAGTCRQLGYETCDSGRIKTSFGLYFADFSVGSQVKGYKPAFTPCEPCKSFFWEKLLEISVGYFLQ